MRQESAIWRFFSTGGAERARCRQWSAVMGFRPMSSVVPSAHGPVLSVLARTDAPLTGRRVAELTNPPTSQRQVSTVLTALTEAGIVRRETQGSAHLYTLNRDHICLLYTSPSPRDGLLS